MIKVAYGNMSREIDFTMERNVVEKNGLQLHVNFSATS